MYGGLKSYADAGRVQSYEQACAVLDRMSRTPTGKPRVEKTWGYHLGASRNHGVTWVRKGNEPGYEGTISFRLYDTDVVTWYPDNSVEIDNFGSVTTSGFAHSFLPAGVRLTYPVERRGVSGGHRGIYYRAADGTYSVCFGELVRMRERDGVWLPDEATLDTITFPELDRKATRALAAQYHLRDFENWLSTAPWHMRIEHDSWELEECKAALLERDFPHTARFLPLVTEPRGFGDNIKPLPILTRFPDQHVTMGSLAKLKLALWDDAGLLHDVEFTTMSQREFDRRMARVNEMTAMELSASHRYGSRA